MPKLDKSRLPEIVSRYNAGETLATLCAEFRITQVPLQRHMRKAGVVFRHRGSQPVYELNVDYFAKIDSEAKAYWLGFLLADGSVNRSSDNALRCQLQLAWLDRDHVEKFRAAIGSNAPIEPLDKGPRLALSRPEFCRHLLDRGCIVRKTGKHGWPSDVPDHLVRHMLRGIFDGDGSIFWQQAKSRRADGSWLRYGQWRASFTGSPKFVATMQQWLRKHGIEPKTPTPAGKRGRVQFVQYGSTKEAGKLLEVLYADATVYLDRKFELFQRVRQWLADNTLPTVSDAELVAAYESGNTIAKLASKYGRSGGAIRKQLYRGGAQMRPRGWNSKRTEIAA